MASKKKLKLKKGVKKRLFRLILVLIIIILGIKGISIYKYHQTYEYKLIQIGYTKEEANKLEDKISKEGIENLLKDDSRDDDVLALVSEKYYLKRNYDLYLDYYKHNKSDSFEKIVAKVNAGAYREFYKDTQETDTSKDILVLVNKYKVLTEDYEVNDLKKIPAEYSYGEVEARKECYNAYLKMAKAAKKDGISLIVTSGYRTYARQEEIYMEMRNSQGKRYADAYAARPGSSEHETGLALDVFTYSATTENFEKTETYKWLNKNAHKYGFIRRYEEGKADITGYSPESWHFRYLGVDTATKVKNAGITYEEYYAYYIEK